MMPAEKSEQEYRLEQFIGNLLRAGVMIAAAVVLAGAVLYLIRFGPGAPHYRVFQGEPAGMRTVRGIVQSAFHADPRGIIQLGLLLLIATPVARVFFALIAFAVQRDRTYVVVTLIVLGALLYSLIGFH